MDIEKAKKVMLENMRKHSLYDWDFKFDKAKKRFGSCRHRTKTITLSEELVKLNSEEQVLDTILHEIAHALVGIRNRHNNVWKQKAKSIGCNGQKYYSKTVEQPKAVMIRYCESCGTEYKYFSKIKKDRECSCGNCSKTFDEKYLLKVKIIKN